MISDELRQDLRELRAHHEDMHRTIIAAVANRRDQNEPYEKRRPAIEAANEHGRYARLITSVIDQLDNWSGILRQSADNSAQIGSKHNRPA